MKTELPEPAGYYRPTRARELREQADRLERRTQNAGRTLVAFLAAGCLLFAGALTGWYRVLPELLIIPAAGIAGALVGVLNRRTERLRAEADALEAEHAARHGTLPDEAS